MSRTGAIFWIIFFILLPVFFIWTTQPYYISEDVAWTITDKYYRETRYENVYIIDIEHTDETGVSQLSLEISEAAWRDYLVGDSYIYPAKTISNWGHLKEFIQITTNG